MGAVMNLAPELFRCVVADVPFVDALTTMLDATLPLTVGEWEEWGNPDASATAYRTMKSYSPYDNVTRDERRRHGARLSAPLRLRRAERPARRVLGADQMGAQDSVTPTKRTSPYLKTEMGAGHGGPSGRYDAWRDEAQVLAWTLNEIVGAMTRRRTAPTSSAAATGRRPASRRR